MRGQYESYRSHPGVDPNSQTETFVALECRVDNWRWAGVPFYLRTGKRMAENARIISIAFREPPQSMFPDGSARPVRPRPPHVRPRRDLPPPFSFYGKRPGPMMMLDKLSMQFSLFEVQREADTEPTSA